MISVVRTRTLKPTKAGSIFGKLVPAPTKMVRIKRESGVVEGILLNRSARRKLKLSTLTK